MTSRQKKIRMKRKSEAFSGAEANRNPPEQDENASESEPPNHKRRKSVLPNIPEPGPLQDQSNKPPRHRRWSCDKDVNKADLQDMGVDLVGETSRDSTSSTSTGGSGDHTEIGGEIANPTTVASNLDGSFLSLRDPAPAFLPAETESPLNSKFLLYRRRSSLASIEPPGPNHFLKLSNEIILNVFRWLPKYTLAQCAKVNKRWQQLAYDDSLWERLDLGMKSLSPGVVGLVMGRGVVLLRLARAQIASPVFSNQFGRTFDEMSMSSKLQYLDLSGAAISVPCLEKVMKSCRALRKLSLENCDVNDTICHSISLNTQLQVLHLAMVRGITDDGIKQIMEQCRGLTELNVAWTELSRQGVQTLTNCLTSRMERLNLSGCRDTLSDKAMHSLCSNSPNLLELDISDATKLTHLSVGYIKEFLTELEALSTSRCYGIPPSTYLELTDMPRMTTLNVFGLLRDNALLELRLRLPHFDINKFLFSSIARPTVGIKRTSIWNMRVRD